MNLEVERTFALAEDQELPALPGLGAAEEFSLEATYYDTRHFALTRSRLVVRRRSGGTDDGWHVKLPGTDAEHRVEHHAPLEAPRLPARLRALVADALAGQALLPVARVRTRRRQAELRDGSRVVALVCIDDVVATVAGSDQTWREAEVELVEGDGAVIEQLTRVFAAAGIHPATGQSKIVRTLGAALLADDEAVGDPCAADVVLDYLAAQAGTLQALEAEVLTDAPDAVHRSRVATRRLRTALRTFGALFDAEPTDRLRDDLARHAAELGAARDAEVMRDGLLAAMDHLEVPADAGERALVTSSLLATHAAAHAELVETMAGPRYDDLHRRLAEWLAAPPLRPAGQTAPSALLHGLLDQARGRVTRRYADALETPEEPAGWHEVRKAAKAVRYCSEALEPVFGGRAVGQAALWEAVTDALGELQDSVVARETIAGLDADNPVLAALVAYQVGRGQAELARGRAALDAALTAGL